MWFDAITTPCRSAEAQQEQEMYLAFCACVSASGELSHSDLKHALSLVGETLTDEEVYDLIEVYDQNKDGKLNYEEFRNMLSL